MTWVTGMIDFFLGDGVFDLVVINLDNNIGNDEFIESLLTV